MLGKTKGIRADSCHDQVYEATAFQNLLSLIANANQVTLETDHHRTIVLNL